MNAGEYKLYSKTNLSKKKEKKVCLHLYTSVVVTGLPLNSEPQIPGYSRLFLRKFTNFPGFLPEFQVPKTKIVCSFQENTSDIYILYISFSL